MLRLKSIRPKSPIFLRALLIIAISGVVFGHELVASWRTISSMPNSSQSTIEVSFKSLGGSWPEQSASPSPKAGVSKPKAAVVVGAVTSPAVQGAKDGENALCRGVTETWKMIPEPGHEGEYVICNVKAEKVGTSDELNTALNNYRKDHGLNTLNINSSLCKVSTERAHEISTNFSHDGFEAATKRSGVDAHSFGENIASGPLSATKFVEWSWDRSPGHRANMLGDWTDGCGAIWDKYAVYLFAKI